MQEQMISFDPAAKTSIRGTRERKCLVSATRLISVITLQSIKQPCESDYSTLWDSLLRVWAGTVRDTIRLHVSGVKMTSVSGTRHVIMPCDVCAGDDHSM